MYRLQRHGKHLTESVILKGRVLQVLANSGDLLTQINITGGFKMMREEIVICGRASTIHFLPYRPDLNGLVQQQGTKDGRGRGQYTWGVDQLQKGDVYVANVCEAILDASHVGDNLGTTIWTKTGNGAVIRGTLRDLYGNLGVDPQWNVMVRDFRPQANSSNLVIGINCSNTGRLCNRNAR